MYTYIIWLMDTKFGMHMKHYVEADTEQQAIEKILSIWPDNSVVKATKVNL